MIEKMPVVICTKLMYTVSNMVQRHPGCNGTIQARVLHKGMGMSPALTNTVGIENCVR